MYAALCGPVRSSGLPPPSSHAWMATISPRRAAIRRACDSTILTLISLFLPIFWGGSRSASQSPYERRSRKKGKGDSENIDFREFPALFRGARVEGGQAKCCKTRFVRRDAVDAPPTHRHNYLH